MKSVFNILSFCLVFVLYSFVQELDCSILKNGKFTYRLGRETVFVDFTPTHQIEYHKNRKYFIKSNIHWLSNCKYSLTIDECTLPDFPFKMGTKLFVEIKKIKGNKVYYKTFFPIDNRTWEGKFTKLKE